MSRDATLEREQNEWIKTEPRIQIQAYFVANILAA